MKPTRYSKGEFTTVPNKSARRGLPPTEQVLLVWLADHSDDDETCYPTRATLAAECGVTMRTLDRAIASLIERKLIVKSARFNQNRQTSNMYEVVIVTPTVVTVTQGGDKKDTPGATNSTRGRATKTAHRTQPMKNSTQLTQVDTEVSTTAATYGKEEVNQLFDKWEEIVGYRISSNIKANRNACNNLFKKYKIAGVCQLLNVVVVANADRFSGITIGDFVELQYNTNKLLAWGRGRGSSGGSKPRVVSV